MTILNTSYQEYLTQVKEDFFTEGILSDVALFMYIISPPKLGGTIK